MGWAKYYEDNMSIYIGRMAVKDSAPMYRVQPCEMEKVSSRPLLPFWLLGLSALS